MIRTVDDFRNAIAKVFEELPLDHCKKYVAGMQGRLVKLREEGGGPIGR